MEIYDNRSETARVPARSSTSGSTARVVAMPTQESAGYWKFCSIVLGVALLIAIVLSSSPQSARASESTRGASTHGGVYEHPALVEPMLRIGGFDSIDGVPVFVMVDQTGQRVGVMAMPSNDAD